MIQGARTRALDLWNGKKNPGWQAPCYEFRTFTGNPQRESSGQVSHKASYVRLGSQACRAIELVRIS